MTKPRATVLELKKFSEEPDDNYYAKIKFKDPEKDPYYLVYASPSFYNQQPGIMSAVLVYKINHDYNPQN